MANNLLSDNHQKYHQSFNNGCINCNNGCFSSCNGCMDTNGSSSQIGPDSRDAIQLQEEEMKKLSLNEREQAYEDMHGVGDIINEDDDKFVENKLKLLEIEICNIKNRHPAYLLALQMSKQFVYDRKFRLSFLRSQRFDPVISAKKFVSFFELKLKLFGPTKLTKRICISDLDDDDQHSLTSGRCQVLPCRDRAGRAIIANLAMKSFRLRTVDAMLRALWYTYMSVVEDDEESQRRGIVNIMHLLGSFDKEDPRERQLLRRVAAFAHSLPYRVTCVHFCLNKKRLLTLAAVLAKGLMSQHRARMKFHYGSHTECEFSLMTYGIPLYALPLSSNENVKVDNHIKWVQRRMIKENHIKHDQHFVGIELPKKNDILFGKGKPIQNHFGNERLREIIENYEEQYETCKRREKKILGFTIVGLLKSSGCRFLKPDHKSGYWFEVSDDIACTKVCAGFRTLRFNATVDGNKDGNFNIKNNNNNMSNNNNNNNNNNKDYNAVEYMNNNIDCATKFFEKTNGKRARI